MAILYSQAPLYPVVGQRVVLGATQVPSGQRVRWRLISAPATSKLELYSTRNLLYLDDGRFDPDIEGKYVLEAVVESFASHIPHFAGDGSVTSNPVEEWTELSATSQSVYVGCKMQRTLGLAPDQCTLTMHCIDTASTCGVLTSFYDEELAPKLEDPTSDRARIAMGAPDVLESLARIGGKDYTGLDNLISTTGHTESSVMQSAFYHNDYGGLVEALKAASFAHRYVLDWNAVHGVADTAEEVTDANASDLTTVCALLNSISTHYEAHRAKGKTPTSFHPLGADAANAITAPSANTLAKAIALANDIRAMYEAHRARSVPITSGHDVPADGMSSARVTAQICWDLTSCIALANDLKACFNAHITHTKITGTPGAQYHLLIDTSNVTTTIRAAVDGPTLVNAANTLADMIHAHVSNIVWSDKSAGVYHYVEDAGSAMDKIPRASTEQEAIELLDHVLFYFLRHVDTQGPWHGGSVNVPAGCVANPGYAWIRLWGVPKLVYDFALATRASDFGGPANGLTSQSELISLGGFAKG